MIVIIFLCQMLYHLDIWQIHYLLYEITTVYAYTYNT